jgi:hypothetical protein
MVFEPAIAQSSRKKGVHADSKHCRRRSIRCRSSHTSSVDLRFHPLTIDPHHQLSDGDVRGTCSAREAIRPPFPLVTLNAETDVAPGQNNRLIGSLQLDLRERPGTDPDE